MNISSDDERNAIVLKQEKEELAHIKNGTELGECLRNGRTRSGSGSTVKARASRHGYHTNLAQGVIGGIPAQISNGTGCTREVLLV